jgi:AraC-like DNA-binding protein
MPSSAVHTFTDPDDYAAADRAANVEINITGRGHFAGKIVSIELHRLWMQRFSDNLPWVGHSTTKAGRAIFSFRIEPGPNLLAGGIDMQPTSIVQHSEGQSYHRRSSGFANYGSMSLPVEEIVPFGEAMAAFDLTPPRDAMLITPPPGAMTRLQRLHAAAGQLAEHAPEIIANPDAARGLEQELIEAVIGCLAYREGRKNRSAQGQHAIVMHRFWRVVEENPEQPVYLPDICKGIRVSARTLRMCCQEHLGMGPKHYLWLRRMHLARRALRAGPHATTVTDIATRYGFWHLGRFAVEYQSLFGESPSATLRQSEQHEASFCQNWIAPSLAHPDNLPP